MQAVEEVELATSGDLTLSTGATPSLRITAVHGDRLVPGRKGDVGSLGEVRHDLVLAAAHLVELSGSGAITLTGRTGRQAVELDGSGDYRAAGLDSTQGGGAGVQTDIEGSGSVEER